MIPTYNCAQYLERTLASLTRQGIDKAQVEVVDDCSTEDDPEAVVHRLGAGLVGFSRQPRNLGLVGNFNSCIGRAERPWVHLLHGDDVALPGAYASFAELLGRHPDCGVVFGRSVMIDEDDVWDGLTKVLGPGVDGRLAYDPFRWALNPVQFAGTIFRRDAALAVGAFDDRYAHAADWDLWWKLAKQAPAAYTNRCLGGYRRFQGSHTSTLVRTASNLREGLRLVHQIAEAEPQAAPELYAPLFRLTVEQARRNAGDTRAMAAHLRLLASFPSGVPRARKITRMALAWAKARVVPVEDER